MIELFFC